MSLFLHTPHTATKLNEIYQKAFNNAVEIFVVTAYLTEWDSTLKLNDGCKKFRLIVGKDFGITKKDACIKVMKWLPSERKYQFMVAERIDGFHPKAIFWKDKGNQYHSLIGSSNLTKAAFNSNYEANIYSIISEDEYKDAEVWIKEIEKQSLIVSEDWLSTYNEHLQSSKKSNKNTGSKTIITSLTLPHLLNPENLINQRRKALSLYENKKGDLLELFRKCALGTINSKSFYQKLPNSWGYEVGNRLQGEGWERTGKQSNFKELSISFIEIINASPVDRDDVVVKEIDKLNNLNIPTRSAFLSEMLCLAFPEEYPILNKPVKKYLSEIRFKAPRGSSEGCKYLDLAKKLHFSLLQNPNHPAKNLAELDTIIWSEYSNK